MNFPSTTIETVWHVGTLELSDRTNQESLEGELLSVSQHPEEWENIARCSGQTWEMHREGAQWLDALALSDAEIVEIETWAIQQGFAIRGDVWRVWHFDGESDDWSYFEFNNEDDALDELDPDIDDDEIPSESGKQIDKLSGLLLTPSGQEKVGRWHSNTQALDPMIILWADIVLKSDNPDLMGVWWYEDDNPLSLSCPRGGAFPDRLGEFKIHDELGREPPKSFLERLSSETNEPLCGM